MNFRRKLKHILKNAQRNLDYNSVAKQLEEYGLYGGFGTLALILTSKYYSGAQGRHIYRIGKAAKKQNLLVKIWEVAEASHLKKDLREIKFFNKLEKYPEIQKSS